MRLKKVSIIIVLISYFANSQTYKGPYFATGIRIGDVSQNEAIIWTRLTKK
jgi:phosphodiesterase/alkaline phosphatase D-like protein